MPVKNSKWTPPSHRHGFDFWYVYNAYGQDLRLFYWSTYAKRDEFEYVDRWSPEHEIDKAIEFIDLDGKRPISITLSINPTHTIYDKMPDKYLGIYNNNLPHVLENFPDMPPEDDRMGKLTGTTSGNNMRLPPVLMNKSEGLLANSKKRIL